jgi:nitronate monooxygenase
MLLGLKYPVIQAPMGRGFTPSSLVIAVSNLGALGSFGGAFTPAEDLRKSIREIRAKTQGPFNINLFTEHFKKGPFETAHFAREVKRSASSLSCELGNVPHVPSYEEQLQVVLEEKVPVFSFTFGMPQREWVRDLKKHKTFVIGSATHLEEVRALEDLGVDAIVCQGKEAGGHRGTFLGNPQDALVPTFTFLKEAKRITRLPLISAGGIMDRSDVQKALKEGAAAVQMGTAFLTCAESGTPQLHRKALLEWRDRKAVLTSAFSGKLARAIENQFIRDMAPFAKDVPPFPATVFLLDPMKKAAAETNNGEFLPLWAGEHFARCKKLSVKELIESLF